MVHYGRGHSVVKPRPGDFLLIHGECWISALVYSLQRLRFRGEDRRYNYWSHVALVANARGRIIEVVPGGVVARSVEKYRSWDYHYVHVNAFEPDRRDAVSFAESCVGQPYSVAGLLGLCLAVLTRGLVPLADRGQQSCAALVVRALARETGAIFPRTPPDMMPADLAKHYGITP